MLAVPEKAEESFEDNDKELSEVKDEDLESKSVSSVMDDDEPENEDDVSSEIEDDDDVSSENEDDDVSSENDSVDDSDEQHETSEEKDTENAILQPSGSKVVESILARDAEARAAISVSKVVDLQFDLGRLLACDSDLDCNAVRKSRDEYLQNLARDNTQLLINQIWQLPISREGTEILAKLPDPAYKLPREKPVPQPKTPTKWEKFALEKGISKKKRGSLRWDEELQKWVPWWGYKRAHAEKEKNWMVEARDKDDPFEDPFVKKKAEKVERVAKNEYQRLRNIAVANKVKIPRTVESLKKAEMKLTPRAGFLTADKMSSEEMKKAITIARTSTASAGKFQSKLPKEKTARSVKPILPIAMKRDPPKKLEDEQRCYLKMVETIIKKKPKLDVDKAVNRQFYEEERARAEEKKNEKPKGRGGKRGRGGRSGGKGGKGRAKGGQNKARKGKR